MLREIYLVGGIGPDIARMACVKMDKLIAEDATSDIFMFIDSIGGCIASMLAITDKMQSLPCDIHTIVLGKAMSAGAFIAAHGTVGKRKALPNAHFMFHEPNGMAVMTPDGMKVMDWCNDVTADLLAKRAGLAPSEYSDLIDRDFYISADDLVNHKGSFLDEVIGFPST